MIKFKRIVVLTLAIFLISITGCKKNEATIETKNNATPLFYQITKPDSNQTIYLLGSIHVADDTAYPLSDKIMNAFSNSDYLAVEIDTNQFLNDYNKQLSLAKKLLYTDGTTIKDHLGEELYNSLVHFLKERNSYNSLYDNYKPAFFESLLENLVSNDSGLDSNKGIDNYFLNLANEQEKQILEVESVEFQFALLASVPDEISQSNINSYINDYEKNVEDTKLLFEVWKRGNVKEINESLFSEDYSDLSETEQELMEQYNNSLILDRNYNMAKQLDKYYRDGKNVFCVVGLGHVVGDEGIVSLIKKDGYVIEEIR